MSFFAKLKRKVYKNLPLFKLAGLLFGLLFVSILTFKTSLPLLGKIPLVVNNPVSQLKSDAGRINILLLGTGGGGHDSPDLTDTMILASLPATQSGAIYFISIPRDIYLDYLNDKINAAYLQGEEKRAGSGLVLAKAAVGQVTGLPVHYAVKIDFSVFVSIIDLLGGVDVEVENSFTDTKYPLAGRGNDPCDGQDPDFLCRFEKISFTKGLNHMDGTTALKFARSRHSEDLVEGTDYARSRRQQKIIAAVKHKILALPNLFDFNKNQQIYDQIKNNIDTDINEDGYRGFFNLALRIKDSPFVNINLDENLLTNPPIDPVRGWYLIPENGSFSLVHEFLQQQLGN
jgi:LCP family protein required for cell wall assembly